VPREREHPRPAELALEELDRAIDDWENRRRGELPAPAPKRDARALVDPINYSTQPEFAFWEE
jgi:hypothetical protein